MDEDLLTRIDLHPDVVPARLRRGHTYLDAVFLSDANLEEAIARGADELWVIWTVSERSEWQAGFIGIYFGIIETVANGNFRRIVKRVRRNNSEIAAGRVGEFGRHIELRILRAEVPVHYLMVVGADRVRHCVERDVAADRRWCQEQGIPLKAPSAPPIGRCGDAGRGAVAQLPQGPRLARLEQLHVDRHRDRREAGRGPDARLGVPSPAPLSPLPAAGYRRLTEVVPERRVTWEVTLMPGFHARHTYWMEPHDAQRSRFGSWEVAEGPMYRLLRPFWLAHFRFVCRESLRGAERLAEGPARPGTRR